QGVAPTGDEREDATVIGEGEPEASVLLGDLHPERAELEEALEHGLRDFRRALDLLRVHVAFQEGFNLPAKGFAGGTFVRRLRWREEQGEIGLADEEARHKARSRQALAGFLDPLQALEKFGHRLTPRRRESSGYCGCVCAVRNWTVGSGGSSPSQGQDGRGKDGGIRISATRSQIRFSQDSSRLLSNFT